MSTVTVRIENTYACGRESSATKQVRYPEADEDIDDWWDVEIQPLTGDGHSCGSSERASYEATILHAPDMPDLVGQTWSAEG